MSWPTRCARPFLVFSFALGCQGNVENPPVSTGGGTSVGGSSMGAGAAAGTGAGAVSGAGAAPGAGGSGAQAGSGGSAGGTAGMAGSVPTTCNEPVIPRAPLRRLTRFEYNNSVRDLSLVDSRPADELPGEELGTGFGNDADSQSVSRLLVDGYRTVARKVAEAVTADAAGVSRVAGCDPASGEDACRLAFIGTHLQRVFRRPAEAEEAASYEQTFTQGQMIGGDFGSGVRAVVERSLQSAQFLYRVEVGETVDAARGMARPTGYEMASRLSFLLWGSTPDDALLAAARDGRLATGEGVLLEAQRLLADGRAKDSLRYFHAMLFGTGGLDHLERDAELYPTFQPGMGALFRKETEAFLDDVVWSGAGDLATIFNAPYTYVNGPLATFYGIPNVTGDAFQKVNLDTTRRSGILTQASILTLTTPGSRTDPVIRGKWVYTKVLCGTIDDPPPDIPELPDPVPGQSVRERLALHRASAACAGCHELMDPLGLAFEHFDGVGLWRDTENGAAIDASGAVPDTDVAGPFNGVVELANKLSQSRDVRSCYAGRYLTYAYGRAVTAEDACNRAELDAAFEQAQGSVKELILGVTQTDGFLLRPVIAPGQ